MWTNLIGDESLEAEDIGWGLEGAENIGQEGERGEVGLGDVALMSTYTQNVQFTAYRFYKNNHLHMQTVLDIISGVQCDFLCLKTFLVPGRYAAATLWVQPGNTRWKKTKNKMK